MDTALANVEQADYWNGEESAHWLLYEDRYEAMLAPFTDQLLQAAVVSGAEQVLDVGCGCGATTRAAGRMATEGEALGVDLSEPLLRRGEQRTREEGLRNVFFEMADVRTHKFVPAVFDVAISRFGVMFFADPVAAFANIARALRPKGRLIVVCWAEAFDNEWIVVPGAAAARYVALPAPDDSASPGPFSLADPERISTILKGSGRVDAHIKAMTQSLVFGADVTETVEFLKATGFGRRLLNGAQKDTIVAVTEALKAALEPYRTPEGIRLGSKAWLATASRST